VTGKGTVRVSFGDSENVLKLIMMLVAHSVSTNH
jgi:hypothetical protein